MTERTSAPFSATQIQSARNQAAAIGAAGVQVVQTRQFVFFAAFDGTNNTKEDPAFAGDPQSTSVGQIFDQCDNSRPGGYYPGPGTPGTLMHSSFNPATVTQQIKITVEQAYKDFERDARAWLAEDPNPLENDADVLRFLDGINAEQLWLRRIEDSLEFSVLGTPDKVTISDWYLGEQHQVERFVTSDNQVLLNSQIDNLVQAMASFAPPPPGQTSFTPAQQSALAPVIAANWN